MTEQTIRKDAKWAKVSGKRGNWIAALGYRGNFAADRVMRTATKDHAMLIARNFVADQA